MTLSHGEEATHRGACWLMGSTVTVRGTTEACTPSDTDTDSDTSDIPKRRWGDTIDTAPEEKI